MNKNGFIEVLIPGLIVALAVSGAILYRYVFNAQDDNPIEEVAEAIIQDKTGELIDLSPCTPEEQLLDMRV